MSGEEGNVYEQPGVKRLRYPCAICGRSDVRLYRPHQAFPGDVEPGDVRCNAHLRRNSLEWMVPCREGDQGQLLDHGTGDFSAWVALPEAHPLGPSRYDSSGKPKVPDSPT